MVDVIVLGDIALKISRTSSGRGNGEKRRRCVLSRTCRSTKFSQRLLYSAAIIMTRGLQSGASGAAWPVA